MLIIFNSGATHLDRWNNMRNNFTDIDRHYICDLEYVKYLSFHLKVLTLKYMKYI